MTTPTPDQPTTLLLDHFGVKWAESAALAQTLLDDLSESGGIGWWRDVPIRRRILLGDFAYQAASQLPTRMVAAHVALASFVEAHAKDEAHFQQWHSSGESGVPTQPATVADALVAAVAQNNLVAVLGALLRSLDLAAAVGIIVFDIPLNAKKAAWSQLARRTETDLAWISGLEDRHGPSGWLRWLTELRNSVTHRPGSLDVVQVLDTGPDLHLPASARAEFIRLIRHLPDEPDLSFIEGRVTADDSQPTLGLLGEDAAETLTLAIQSVNGLVEEVAKRAKDHWISRRSEAKQQQSFQKQWKRPDPVRFQGFAPGSLPIHPQQALMNPVTIRRMIAGHAIDQLRAATWAGWPNVG